MSTTPPRRPARPKLTPHRESIVPEIPPPGAPAPAPAAEPTSATLSVRTDAEVVKQWHQTVRDLHASTGRQKGVIAAELLRVALAAKDDVADRLKP